VNKKKRPRKSDSKAKVSSPRSINSRLLRLVSEDEDGGGEVGAEQYG